MNAASDGLNLAGDIFVVCMILTVGIVCGRMSNKMSQASSKVINQNTVEYLEADISNLLSSSHTGASVKQYVNKYRRKMRVELVTQKSASAGDSPMLISASTDISRISKKGDEYFVSNDAVFECEADRDTNGNYSTVRFIQSGSQALSSPAPADENDYNGARNYLNGLLGFSDTTGWDVITRQIKSDYSDSETAKTNLLQALNSTGAAGSVSNSSNLTEISDVVGSQFQRMQDNIDGLSVAEQHRRQAKTLNAGQALTLDLSNPKVLILKNASTGLTYVWTSENAIGWVNDNKPSVTISGNSITNESMTDSYDVIAYN